MTLTMNAPTNSRNIPRSIGACVAGFATVAILSMATDTVLHAMNYYPNDGTAGSDGQLAFALAYRTAFTILGGYIAARLAPSRGMLHAVIIGAIGTLAAAGGAAAMWHVGHNWYAISLAALALPSTALGGWLFTRNPR
ncbi:MAG: hypothetical protein ABIQ30_00395 [Devosia sp.]